MNEGEGETEKAGERRKEEGEETKKAETKEQMMKGKKGQMDGAEENWDCQSHLQVAMEWEGCLEWAVWWDGVWWAEGCGWD